MGTGRPHIEPTHRASYEAITASGVDDLDRPRRLLFGGWGFRRLVECHIKGGRALTGDSAERQRVTPVGRDGDVEHVIA
jgi:hypothetical protein